MKSISFCLLLSALLIQTAYPQRYVKIVTAEQYKPSSLIIQRVILNANDIAAYFQSTGIFDQNTTSGNTSGMEWPKGSGRTAMFTAGLCIGCGINGQYAQVMASYKGEYSPGRVLNGSFYTDADFKMYTVKIGDNAQSNPDYANWYKMVPYGAPYVDRNNNGIYDQGIDMPGVKDAAQTIFEVMTDADISSHSPGEGFGGGITNPLLKAEIAWTSWAYNSPGLENVQFIKWRIINKGSSTWDSTFMGVVTDPDLGDAVDDYIGCDTTLNLGYCYNSDNMDGTGSPPTYGAAPPAVGLDFFRGAIKKNAGGQNDTLGLTSFTFFIGTGAAPPPCESDPNGEPIPAYNMLQGLKKDRTPYMDVTKTPPKRTKFCYYGDPETQTGWTESKGSMYNCNGDTSGTIIPTDPGNDRRFIQSTGRIDFKVSPNDTQTIIVAQLIARGSSNLNSVTKLKALSVTAQLIYDSGFDAVPRPPVPFVYQSVTPLTPSTCGLNIYWNDAAESYRYWDTVFYQKSDSNIYDFEGYEIYEVNKNLPLYSLPDFSRPTTIDPNQIKLVKIFDKRNSIGVVVDTLPTGVIIGGNELYSPMPIVPPYGLGMPSDFPNTGISRLVQMTSTLFPENYGGVSTIQYGQTYKYIVGAYAVSKSTHIRKGFKVIRTTLGTALFNAQPQPYSNNITFTLHNGDTIRNNRVDLGVTPVVVGQQYVQEAKYRVVFNSPDTAYSILKSTNNGVSFSTLKTGLRALSINTSSHDSSRIFDGILFRVDNIRFGGVVPNFIGNFGIIKDPTLRADSIQTRQKGWEYLPYNNYVTGSKYVRDVTRPWQAPSISVSYPSAGTFTNLRSAILPEVLRKVKIVYSNTNKQYAYRYLDSSAFSDNFYIYQGMTQVPFKVYDADYLDSSSSPRQLNCAFVESNDVQPSTGQWAPGADSLGRKLLLYIFNSNYDTSIVTPYKNRNLFLSQSQFDIMFVWAPRLLSSTANFAEGDSLMFYPYTVTRPGVIYEFSTTSPVVPVIEISSEVPDKFDMMQNYPNPFNPETNIRFALPEKSFVTMKVYNVLGQLVETLIDNKRLEAGTHQTSFNGSRFASGIYFYAIQTEKYTQTKRMVLLK
ncbi:MAG: T9SS type A sorting domain-containing protein [Ignavibacteriota bacterium]